MTALLGMVNEILIQYCAASSATDNNVEWYSSRIVSDAESHEDYHRNDFYHIIQSEFNDKL